MNIIGLAILSIVLIVVLFAPTRWACLGMVAGALYLTFGQQVNLLGLNMYALRFIEVAGFGRVAVRREFSLSKLNGIDWTLLLLYSYETVVFLMRSSDGQFYQIGSTLDAFLCYFAFRGLCPDVESFTWLLRMFAFLLVPYVALVMTESFTGHNPFSIIGGSVLGPAWLREGRLRCVASFRHPSLLGTLGASFLPLYIGLWFSQNEYRRVASVGVVLCLAIVWASNSGGPIGCAAVAVVGWMLWMFRRKMRAFRWGIAVFIALAAITMKAPVWYLLARFSALSGGDGWHRSYLLDRAFQNFDKWWLGGIAVTDTASWFPYVLGTTGGADMTNNYLLFGIVAGLGAMILFVYLLVLAFRKIGQSLEKLRSENSTRKGPEFIYWGLGVMLAVHVFNWFGITYFDQTYAFWFMQLAIISTLTQQASKLEANLVNVRVSSHGSTLRVKSRFYSPGLVRRSTHHK